LITSAGNPEHHRRHCPDYCNPGNRNSGNPTVFGNYSLVPIYDRNEIPDRPDEIRTKEETEEYNSPWFVGRFQPETYKSNGL